MLRLYNSLTQKKEPFKPLTDNHVTMYVCGITPYDTTHLGHAFTYVSFDVLIRYFQYQGYEVNYTQNITDIDDDILKRAAQEKRDWKELGEFWTKKFLNDLKALNVLMPTHYVKATDSIPTIISIVSALEKKKFAYEKNGTVYFAVKKFMDYGKLSKYTSSEMIELSKERGADPDDKNKQHPLDFILWQPVRPFDSTQGKQAQGKKNKMGEPFWESPWGKGRPGWHIECSAMIQDYLGKQIDIHGGGFDLIYPHHESEIAQSESYTGIKPFVNTWMHTAMLKYQGEKMSKSLGNLVMVSDLLKKYSPNAIRYVLLSHHYRKQWEFEEKELAEAEKKMSLLCKSPAEKINNSKPAQSPSSPLFSQFIAALDDDLNTPLALTRLSKLKGHDLHQALTILGFQT